MHADLDDTVRRALVTAPRTPRLPVPDIGPTVEMHTTTRARALSTAPPPLPVTAPPPTGRAMAIPAPERLLRIRIGDDPPIALSASIIVGRRPARPRIPEPVAPRLIKVASPSSEVSASHVELKQVGRAVVARDLRTANGSKVTAPRKPTRLLAQGEEMVVPVGATIEIGDGIVIKVLAPMAEESAAVPRS